MLQNNDSGLTALCVFYVLVCVYFSFSLSHCSLFILYNLLRCFHYIDQSVFIHNYVLSPALQQHISQCFRTQHLLQSTRSEYTKNSKYPNRKTTQNIHQLINISSPVSNNNNVITNIMMTFQAFTSQISNRFWFFYESQLQ